MSRIKDEVHKTPEMRRTELVSFIPQPEEIHEVHEVHENCVDCNMYVENGSSCEGLEEWDDEKCLKIALHKKTGFMSGGGEPEKDKLKIVM